MHLRFSFQSDLSHQLDDNLGEVEKLPSMEVYDLSEENRLGNYMSLEIPVPERGESQSLTQEELGQGKNIIDDSIIDQLVP